MTKKQKKNLVNELVQLELIIQNPSSSDEERKRAEQRIYEITKLCMTGPYGLECMMEIDEQVQIKLNQIKEN